MTKKATRKLYRLALLLTAMVLRSVSRNSKLCRTKQGEDWEYKVGISFQCPKSDGRDPPRRESGNPTLLPVL